MGKVKDAIVMLNGKKLPLTALMTALIGVGILQAQVKNNTKEVDNLRPAVQQMQEQIARIDERTKDTKEDLIDFRTEQRAFNTKLYDAIMAK